MSLAARISFNLPKNGDPAPDLARRGQQLALVLDRLLERVVKTSDPKRPGHWFKR